MAARLRSSGPGKVIEDLRAKHVDPAVGEVGQRLGGVRLFLKALDPAVGAGDRHSELARVLDPLRRQGGDPVVRLVGLAHCGEVDVGEGVARDDQEGVGLAEEVRSLADAAGGSQRLLLLAVGELDAEAEPSPK